MNKRLEYLNNKRVQIIDNCPICKGKQAFCECQKQYYLEVKKVEANIPLKYISLNLDSINNTHFTVQKNEIDNYLKHFRDNYQNGVGLFLWGESEIKSALGTIVLVQALASNFSVYYTTLSDCIKMVLGSGKDEEMGNEFNEKVIQSDFLMIDNLGSEYSSEKRIVENIFETLFQSRTENLNPLILTSQSSPEIIIRNYAYSTKLLSLFNTYLIKISFTNVPFQRLIND
jgi:DNA replication protein DnaC